MTREWRERFAEAFGSTNPGLIGGDPDTFGFSIDKLRLFGGSEIQLSEVGVTVIVGPNNVGKSTLLREAIEMIKHHPGNPRIPRLLLDGLEVQKAGSPADVVAWIGDHARFVATPQQQPGFRVSGGGLVYPGNVDYFWTQEGHEIGEELGQVVVHYSHASHRFNFAGGAEMRESFSDPPVDPVHQLQDSHDLMVELSGVTEKVFDQALTLDTLGRVIRLRAGRVDVPAPPVDNISAEYQEAMAGIPLLSNQGDGLRSFMGQLLPLVTSRFKIIALDEPEAFLHPPQAYGLGQELGGRAVAGGVQVIIATHDSNLLMGLLDSGVEVSVVRLRRDGNQTVARQLDATKVSELWKDPVLKYTSVLDGLFHRAVILTEAESDCGYYGAAIDASSDTYSASREFKFIPTGGKAGMPRVAKSLVAVGVPVVATADLDLLNDENLLKSAVESVGGEWTEELRKLWRLATVEFRSKREPAKVRDIRMGIDSVLRGLNEDDQFTNEIKEKINAQIRTQGSRWEPVKEYGLAAFKGDAHPAVLSLLEKLDEVGVVLVKAGELERLAPDVPVSKGAGWLPAALNAGAHTNNETQAHVARILAAAQRIDGDVKSAPAVVPQKDVGTGDQPEPSDQQEPDDQQDRGDSDRSGPIRLDLT